MTASLQEVKEWIATHAGFRSAEYIRSSKFQPGVPRGSVTELSGTGKTEVVAQILAENPKCNVAWIEKELTVYPSALTQRKISLDRILFVESGRDLFWAANQVVRSQLFDLIVMDSDGEMDSRELRRLQLEASRTKTGIIWLSEEPRENGWNFSVQARVSRPGFQVEVLRRRGG